MNNKDIENIIYDDSFLKNIKRVFIKKQMEEHNIKKIIIEYDENIKTFKINIEKDTAIYYVDYKIKRRVKKVNNYSCKKRKLNNNDNENNSINQDKKRS